MNTTNKTLDYYNKQAKTFVQGTVDVEFSTLQNMFTSIIPNNGRILDLGCGSGRDTKAFLNKGYDVVSVDGSIEMSKIATEYIGKEVICSTFQEYEPEGVFDGIWACASLLHLTKEDIILVMNKLSKSLKTNGIFYVSFKYGDYIGERNGRFFIDLTEESFDEILKEIPSLKTKHECITSDARPGRENEKWLNVFLVKE